MNCNEIKTGIRVEITKLDDTGGMLINSKHLTVRRRGATGTVVNCVPGHGGDVWFVKHDGSEVVGVYCYTEMERLEVNRMSQIDTETEISLAQARNNIERSKSETEVFQCSAKKQVERYKREEEAYQKRMKLEAKMRDCNSCRFDDQSFYPTTSPKISICEKGYTRLLFSDNTRKSIEACHAWKEKEKPKCWCEGGDLPELSSLSILWKPRFKFCPECGRIIG